MRRSNDTHDTAVSPLTRPNTIIRSSGIFFIIFVMRASRTSRKKATLTSTPSGMHNTTMAKSKLFHHRSKPVQYRSGAAPLPAILSTHLGGER